jgi:hypothetical protein
MLALNNNAVAQVTSKGVLNDADCRQVPASIGRIGPREPLRILIGIVTNE